MWGCGVTMLVRNGIFFDVVNPIPTNKATSNEQITITKQTTKGTHYISTLFCPKKEPSREIIEGFCLERYSVIFTGDFNCKHESFENKTRDSSGTLLKEISDDRNLTYKRQDTKPYIGRNKYQRHTRFHGHLSTNNPSLQGFWVAEDLGSDNNNYWGIFPYLNNRRTAN